MPYSVHIEPLHADGMRSSKATIQVFQSEDEAIAFTRAASHVAQPLREHTTFSLHHPDGRLLMSFTTGTGRGALEAANANTLTERSEGSDAPIALA